jgi:O-antigen/teichoic acid export membrane protein
MFKSIAYGIGASIFSILVLIIGNILQSALVIRFLPPIEAGVWFLYLSIMLVINICDFGLSPTISREIGLSNYKVNSTFRLMNLYGTARKVVAYISVLVLSLFVLSYWIWLKKDASDANIFLSFVIFTIAVIVRFQSNPALAVIYGLGYIASSKNLVSFSNMLAVIVSCGLLKLGYGLIGLCGGYLIGPIILYISSQIVLNRYIHLPKSARFNMLVLKRILNPCIQWSITMVGAILILQISNFVIAAIMGVKFVTSFAVMRQLCTAIITIAGITSFALVPFVSRAWGNHQKQLAHDLFEANVKFSTCIALAMAIYIYMFKYNIFELWLGSATHIAGNTLLILLITTVLEAQHVACSQVSMAAGYVKFAGVAMISGVLNLILSIILVKQYGIIGAAMSIAISQLLTCNWYVVYRSIKYLDFPLLAYFKILGEIALYGLVTIMVCLGIKESLTINNNMVILSLAGFALFIWSLIFLFLFKKERRFVIGLIRK